MDPLEIKVGGVYETRDGREVKIISFQPDERYPWVGSNGLTYTRTGGFLDDHDESRSDLVARKIPPCVGHAFEEEDEDDVNNINPAHYKAYAIEPKEFIILNDLPFWMGNTIKYIMRADRKNGIEDLEKAKRYIDMRINMLNGEDKV